MGTSRFNHNGKFKFSFGYLISLMAKFTGGIWLIILLLQRRRRCGNENNNERRLASKINDNKINIMMYYNLWLSIKAGFQLVLISECVAAATTANCVPGGCGPCVTERIMTTTQHINNNDNDDSNSNIDKSLPTSQSSHSFVPSHVPLYDCASTMKDVCDKLCKLPICWWPHYTLTMVQRYMPILRAKFGSKAAKIYQQEIVDKVNSNDIYCYCGYTDMLETE